MRAKKNIIASYIFIFVNILINLFVVRLTVQHYGDRIYAFVVLAYSFITYVETFNFGTFLSNRTQIPLRGENASVYTLATVRMLCKMSLILMLFWLTVYYLAGDYLITLISSETDAKILKTGKSLINIGILYGIVKIPLSVVLSSFAGHDRVDVEKKYHGAQQLVKFVSLYIAITFGLSVETYFLGFALSGIFILFVANTHYFMRYLSKKTKSFIKYSRKISSFYITKSSFKFYVLTLASVIVWSTDNLLVSIFYTPKMVADYSINFAIYNAAFLFITAIANALIANYGNLIRDNDLEKLNFRINLSLYTTFLIALCICFGGILFSKEIIELWVGSGHHISDSLIMAFGLFGITIGFSSVFNTILSLFANSKTLTLIALSEAFLNITLSVILIQFLNVDGIAFATAIAAFITIIIPGAFVISRHFKGQVKIEFFPLLILFSIAALSSVISSNLSLILNQKILLFILFFFTVVVTSFVLRRDYFNSYLKILSRR